VKICVVHNTGPGGALRMIGEIAQRWALGDDVTVVTWNDDPDPPMRGVRQVHLPVRRGRLRPPLHPFGRLYRSWVGSVRAARWVDAEGFDVVYASACQWVQAHEGLRRLHTPTLYFAQEGRRRSVEPGYVARATDRRSIVRRAGTAAFERIASAMDRRAMRGRFELATNSAHSARQLTRSYGREPYVVELGLDAAVFHADRSRERTDRVVAVGAIDPMKNQMLAIDALGLLPQERRPRLCLVANRLQDDYLAALRSRAHTLGVELEVLIDISDCELVDIYRTSKALVATALNEPFGLTVPEATATGTPVVAVRSGGFVETVVTGVNGVLVEPGATEVADAIDRVVAGSLPLDPALDRWAAERWSWDRCAAEIRELMCGLVAA
jgi:glycosyltransferase involved in cell wall biosynthesis